MTPVFVVGKRRALERSCRWMRGELLRQQEQRLGDLRRFVMQRSPFYQRFHRGLEHAPVHELPELTKATMMDNVDDLVTLLETVPASGWQVRQEEDGLSVRLAGLRSPLHCASIAVTMRQALEARGALVGSIDVTPVDALERGGTGNAPLILARRERRAG